MPWLGFPLIGDKEKVKESKKDVCGCAEACLAEPRSPWRCARLAHAPLLSCSRSLSSHSFSCQAHCKGRTLTRADIGRIIEGTSHIPTVTVCCDGLLKLHCAHTHKTKPFRHPASTFSERGGRPGSSALPTMVGGPTLVVLLPHWERSKRELLGTTLTHVLTHTRTRFRTHSLTPLRTHMLTHVLACVRSSVHLRTTPPSLLLDPFSLPCFYSYLPVCPGA